MKVIITFTFCCDTYGKVSFALEKPGKLREIFSYFVATLYPGKSSSGMPSV